MWREQKWYWCVLSITQADTVLLLNLPAFNISMQAKGTRLFVVTILELRVSGVSLVALLLEGPSILLQFEDLSVAFIDDEPWYLTDHGLLDHLINLQKGKQPSRGQIYIIFKKEFKVLCDNIATNLERGSFQPSTSPSGAPVIFVPKIDDTMHHFVDYHGLNKITKGNYSLSHLIGKASDMLYGTKFLTKPDIHNAYHCIQTHKGDE